MIHRKYKNNEYLLTDLSKIWVRNFISSGNPVDINNMYKSSEIERVISNEIKNQSLPITELEETDFENVLIVSDGYDFLKVQNLIEEMRGDFKIICVNKSLKKWKISKKVDYYVINNPYEDSLLFLPSKYYPPCITSVRTHHEFLKKYRGLIYRYFPTPNEKFSLNFQGKIDDYRNPISAAVALTSGYNLRKLALFACDDSFSTNKAGAILATETLYCYPHQLVIREIVENQISWIVKNNPNVQVGHYSSMNYKNAERLTQQKLIDFFVD